MQGLPSILSLFRNEFNKFNNKGAWMLDSTNHCLGTVDEAGGDLVDNECSTCSI